MIKIEIESINGFYLNIKEEETNNKDYPIIASLIVSTLDDNIRADFKFTYDQLLQLYSALFKMYKSLNKKDSNDTSYSLTTVDLPYINTNHYIAVIMKESLEGDEEFCSITLKKRHVLREESTYITTDIIEVNKVNLFNIIINMDKILYKD